MRDRKLKLIAMVREPSPNISRLILLYKEQLPYKYCLNHFVRYLTCKSKDGLQTRLVRQLHFPRRPFFMIEILIDVFRIDKRDNTIQSCKFLHGIVHEECLRDWRRIGRPRSLDNYAIQLQRPFLDAIGEFLKYFHQILANGTTNTAIHRLNNLLLALHLRVLLQKRASIPTSPNSFSITAVFFLCVAVKIRLSKVVLSEPRKPLKTVTGTLVSSSAFSFVIVSVSAVVWMSSVDSLAGV